jgi:hypothetical protein
MVGGDEAQTTRPLPPPANVSVRLDDPSGMELELTVGGNVRFSRQDDILLGLRFVNRSSGEVKYDSNQKVRFGLFQETEEGFEARWTNVQCSGGDSDIQQTMTGSLVLLPGEEGKFVDRYPVHPAADNTSAGMERGACVLPAGRYAAVGQVEWCPPSSLMRSEVNGAEYCDRAQVVPVASAPVWIELY